MLTLLQFDAMGNKIVRLPIPAFKIHSLTCSRPLPRRRRSSHPQKCARRRRTVWPAASAVRRSSPTRTTKRIAPEKSFLVLHDGYGACIPGLEFAYDNDGSSGHGWRLDFKIREVFALTARAFCGSISLQIEIDSHNTSQLGPTP